MDNHMPKKQISFLDFVELSLLCSIRMKQHFGFVDEGCFAFVSRMAIA